MPDYHRRSSAVNRRPPRARRLAFGAFIIAVCIGALSACVAIPNSGGVSSGLSLVDNGGTADIAFNPLGPEKDSTQQKILQGFVAAFTSATGGYAVAKQFLSPVFASKWDPRQGVEVRSGQAKVATVGPAAMTYSFTSSASVNTDGEYVQFDQSFTLQIGFVKVNGQWRIDTAPNGIVLPDQTFQRIFQQHPLYFLDSSNQYLVPDLRWFPSGTAATRIVGALLAGPPDWLKGAAFSRFPDGTRLSSSGSVIIPDEGVARVDLTKEALGASPREREFMKVQLTQSLRSVSTISSVSISVEGTSLQINDLGSSGPQSDSKVDSQALVLRKNDFGFLANNLVASLGQLSKSVVALNPSAATLSADQNSAVVLGPGGVSMVKRGAASIPPLDSRPDLIPPSLDSYGYVWSVPSSSPKDVHVLDQTGAVHAISLGLPGGSQIVSLEVSREGARVAMLLSTSTGPRLAVAAIVRDEKLVPTGIGPLIVDYAIADGNAQDVTWVDESSVATLVSTGGLSKVELVVIGGNRSSLGTINPAAVQLVGGNDGVNGLRALGTDRAIWTYRGSSWQSSQVKVDFLANQR